MKKCLWCAEEIQDEPASASTAVGTFVEGNEKRFLRGDSRRLDPAHGTLRARSRTQMDLQLGEEIKSVYL